MFWKSFWISFFLHNRENVRDIHHLLMSNKDTIGKSHNNQQELNQSFLNQSFFAGYDTRNGISRNKTLDHMVIMNITQFNEKMNLLQYLKNENISQLDKVNAIAEYKKYNAPSPIKVNLIGGGLYDEWKDVF
jgi:transcription initiation factor IIF auxiliary subunit